MILAILLLVASSLLADTVSYYKSDKHNLCEALKITKADSRCEQLTTGAVSPFPAFLLVPFISIYLASPQGQGHHNSVSQLLWARIT